LEWCSDAIQTLDGGNIQVRPYNETLISFSGGILNSGDVAGTEGNTLSFTVKLSQASTQTFKVDYTTADNSAFAGSDYVAQFGTLTFAPGTTQQTIQHPGQDRCVADLNEDLLHQSEQRNQCSIQDNTPLASSIHPAHCTSSRHPPHPTVRLQY
jgi:hypothetical protein